MPYALSDSILISRPPAAVFAALEDPVVQVTYDGEMYRSTERLTPGPIGAGTRFRGDFKGTGTIDYEYAVFERDRVIEHRFSMFVGAVRHRFEFAPESSGARLTQTIIIEPSLLGRVLWAIAMKRITTRRIHTLNGLVKAYVESR